MINAPFISTAAATAPGLRAIDRAQRQLADAQVELSSGRRANVEVALGAGIRTSVALRQEKGHLAAIADANSLVKARIDGSQAALMSVSANAEAMLKSLLQASSDQAQPGVLAHTARQGLGAIREALNTTMDGVHLFAGVNTDVEPIADYFSPSGSAARSAVAVSFSSTFGSAQSSPGIENVSATAVQGFLDTTFADLFRSPSWNATWSAASDQGLNSRISTHEMIETSVTANEQPVRDIIRAFTMIADLGVDAMNPEARKAVVDTATKVLSEALSGATTSQARLGAAAASVTDANERMAATTRLMDDLLSDRESVDTADVSNWLSALTRDLEAAYAIVARINRLSLLDSI